MAYYLGIDGGGSKTTCAVGDELSRIATVTAGPSNITRVGEGRARESLHEAIRKACGAAQIGPRQLKRACVGVAGAGREEIAEAIGKIVADMIPSEIEVVGDMEIGLAAAFGAGPGAIVIAGTGSIAYGRDAQGRTARAGGWGFAISDEGSAHWIGRAAVTALLRAVDRGVGQGIEQSKDDRAAQASPLFHQLKAAWNLHALEELVRTANSNPDFAALFPAVPAAAEAGDAVAQRVLAQAGGELAQLAGIVIQRLFVQDAASLPAAKLAMAGGVFRHAPSVREAFCSAVHKLEPQPEVLLQIVDPVEGALHMARRGQSPH
ncbi:MAG: BadF/BadG/BcrA/BcrD ATPase family protein [Candidatus Sulfotelmatobacter sp.]